MATYINEPAHTFNEYLLIPGYSDCSCIPANVSLKTPLVRYKKRRSTGHHIKHSNGFCYHAGRLR